MRLAPAATCGFPWINCGPRHGGAEAGYRTARSVSSRVAALRGRGALVHMYEHIDRQTRPLHVGSQYIARAVSRVGAAQGRLLPLLPCPIILQRTAPQPNISVSTWPYLLQPSLRPFARRRCVCQALLCFCGVSLATNRRRRKRVRPTPTRSRTATT